MTRVPAIAISAAALITFLGFPLAFAFAQGTFGGGLGDTPAGGECLSSDDCQSGLSCAIASGNGAGTCTAAGSSAANPAVSNGSSASNGAVSNGSSASNPAISNGSSAANPAVSSGAGLQNPLNAPDLPTLLNEVLGYVITLGTIALTVMLVYVGFLFVAARGNSEKVSQARQALVWTIIGGLLLLGAQALSTVIASTIQSL